MGTALAPVVGSGRAPAWIARVRIPHRRSSGSLMARDDSLRRGATTQLSIGDPVPTFSLPDTDGAPHAAPLDEAPVATVLVVTCNHCPYVIASNPRLKAA